MNVATLRVLSLTGRGHFPTPLQNTAPSLAQGSAQKSASLSVDRRGTREATIAVLTPIFYDPHVCKPPPTWGRTEYAEFECLCGCHWFLSWFRMPSGEMVGPSWILEAA